MLGAFSALQELLLCRKMWNIVQLMKVWVTGKKPVCSSLCVKIVEWDCAKLDFLKCLKYNLDMVTYK